MTYAVVSIKESGNLAVSYTHLSYCRQAELDVQQTSGMEYNPLTKRYSMSADTGVNYLFATRKPI